MDKQPEPKPNGDSLINLDCEQQVVGGTGDTDHSGKRAAFCPFAQSDVRCDECRYWTVDAHCAIEEQWGAK